MQVGEPGQSEATAPDQTEPTEADQTESEPDQAVSAGRAEPAGRGSSTVSTVLARWRARSTLPPSYWNDGPDRALVRTMLGDRGDVRRAIQDFAVAQADAGATLPECCDHLAALSEALPDHHAGEDVWRLAPVVADVFFGNPADWGLDPMTGCLTASCLHAVLHGLYRRAAAMGRSPSRSAFLAVVVEDSGDVGQVISGEMETARLLNVTVPEAEAIAHVRRGGFVALLDASQLADSAEAVGAALRREHLRAHVRAKPLPSGLSEARRLLDSILAPRDGSR
jgi:hypothetical protein